MNPVSYDACLDRIYQLGRFGIKLELDTIYNILQQLKEPQSHYHTIHIAGTNGKGSTAAYISSILTQAGFKTGLYTSPHLVRFNERILVNQSEISNDDVVDAYTAVNDADNGPRKATFFEIATAMAFYHFQKAGVEWAIIETGMGGRFDATNIITPRVSVITNLSIEHTDYLGGTIEKIAVEKGGIIKPGRPVVTAVSQASGLKVLNRLASERGSDIHEYKKSFTARKQPKKNLFTYKGIRNNCPGLTLPLPGDHQKENMCLALAACELAFPGDWSKRGTKDPGGPGEENIRTGIKNARWPGRLEYIRTDPLVILDGAHNAKAATVLAAFLKNRMKNRYITLVIGILDDKPYGAMLKTLAPCADRIFLTKASIDRAVDPSLLADIVRPFFDKPVHIVERVADAMKQAIEITPETGVVCCAGSLYVAGEAKQMFENNMA